MVCETTDPSNLPPIADCAIETIPAVTSHVIRPEIPQYLGQELPNPVKYIDYDARITVDPQRSYDPDGRIVLYEYSFVQISGNKKFEDYHAKRSGNGMITHTYKLSQNEGGLILVTLKVTDDDNMSGSTSKSVTICHHSLLEGNQPPEPHLSLLYEKRKANAETGQLSEIVAGASGSIDPDGSIVDLDFCFEKISGKTKESPVSKSVPPSQYFMYQEYALEDNETAVIKVTLTITDDCNATSTIEEFIKIEEYAPPSPFFKDADGFESALFFIAIAGLIVLIVLRRKSTS